MNKRIIGRTVGTTMNPEMLKGEGGGGSVDLSGYATEDFVAEYAQPKGDYLNSSDVINNLETMTANKPLSAAMGFLLKGDVDRLDFSKLSNTAFNAAIAEYYNKTETESFVENYAQEKGDYALRSDIPDIPDAPVKSVNNKTGAVQLNADDVGARPNTWTPTYSDVGAAPSGNYAYKSDIPTVPTKVSAFENDKGYLTSFTESDPTVPSWAKASTKPKYTASEVGAAPSDKTITITGVDESGATHTWIVYGVKA